ncbi:MAG: tRNA pseudouridine(38-40) synthase TruA [Ignavibacteriales bacterium CG_4_9_14_3_um_filter_30_11]|nr:MAG: tRNA pseudouridine(38-40) synthase TruA [Ignavibacteriales bacterium CG_4_9_14_3_um_filter_30_11]
MNYKLKIQYDGTNYCGWQIQKNSVTVQQVISDSITVITKQKVNLIGSGRTDTGVHALGQVANFIIDEKLNIYRFKHSLNSILPFDISVIEMDEIKEDFHSRFDAKKRCYIYLFSKLKSPFYNNYSYFLHDKIDITYLNDLCKCLLGENDFTSFSRKNVDIKNKDCIIYNIHWKELSDKIIFYIEANRFLHGMVRTIIGTLLDAQKNNWKKENVIEIIKSENREKAGEAIPAKGLFLYKVKY